MPRVPYVLLVAAVLLLPARVSAAGLSVGVTGLTNATYLSGDEVDGTGFTPRVGLQGGVTVEAHLNPRLSLVTAAILAHKAPGLDIPLDDDAEAVREVTAQLDYVVVPLLARYTFADEGLRFHVEGGMEVSFLQGATLAEEGQADRVVESALESTDVAVAVGLGLQGDLGRFTWLAGLRFAQGLRDIAADDPAATGRPPVWKSRGQQLLLGLSYPLFGE